MIEGGYFLKTFSSDRSHMLTPEGDGYLKTPPPWPVIGEGRESNLDELLDRIRDMSPEQRAAVEADLRANTKNYLWMPNPDLYWVAKLTMPIALILLVGGFMVKNPTNVGMSIEDPDSAADMARGVTRITRHPLQWAIVLWAAGHIVANGDVVSIIFFSSFLLLSGVGSFLMDQKKAFASSM